MTRPGEKGAILKTGRSLIPVALVYPSSYRVGMANLGYQFVYAVFNAHSRFVAERFFFSVPAGSPGDVGGVPRSEESGRPLSEFPVIAFSVPFENDYPAVPRMLMDAGIAPLQRDRGPGDPVVIAGGVSVSMNPEPLAPFLDMAFVGEMDDADGEQGFLGTLAESFSGSSIRHGDRNDFLHRFREVPGVYVPSAYVFERDDRGLVREIRPCHGFPERVVAWKRSGRDAAVPASVLHTPEAEFGNTFLVEANRGCTRGCRFCATGWIHSPVKYARFSKLEETIDRAVRDGRTVGLIGSDLAGHPDLEDILSYIVKGGGRFSLSSLRPEALTPAVMELMAGSGQRTATLAPETASRHMKRVIGKQIPSERFLDLVEALVRAGIPNLRYYFMVGLPGETDDDVREIAEFVLKSREVFVEASRSRKTIGTMGVQLNPFVPKPWTPFQWSPMQSRKVLRDRLTMVQQTLRKVPNLTVRVESARQALMQGLLARGDRTIYPGLLVWASQGGKWTSATKKASVDVDFFVHRQRDEDEIFPWDVIDHGIKKEKLLRTYKQAMNGRRS